MIQMFVRLAETLSVPRSVGEIYGLFFCSSKPLCFEDVVEQLRISSGSASQGIRFLRSIGAIQLIYEPGDRRDHFSPETGLRKLVGGFLNEKVVPQVRGGSERLSVIENLLQQDSAPQALHLSARLDLLRNWHRKAARLLPILARLVG